MSRLKFLTRAYKQKDLKYWGGICLFVLLTMGLNFSFFGSAPSNASSEKEQTRMKRQYSNLKKQLQEMEKSLAELEEKDRTIYRSYFAPEAEQKAVSSAPDIPPDYLAYNDEYAMKHLEKKANFLDRQIREETHSLERIIRLAKKNDAKYSRIPAIQPIAKKDMKNVVSGFGLRFHPILKIRRMHTGLDFSAKQGAPVYATADGTVKVAEFEGGFGNVVRINHQNGYMTSYAHLQSYKVKVGQSVKRGQVIGYVGNTGLSTGPHLHYEVMKKGEKVDPLGYFYDDLSPDEYKKMVIMAEKMTRSLD